MQEAKKTQASTTGALSAQTLEQGTSLQRDSEAGRRKVDDFDERGRDRRKKDWRDQ